MSTQDGGAAAPAAPSFDSLFEKHFGDDIELDGGDTGAGAGTPADHDDEALFEDGDDNLGDRDPAGDENTDDDEWDDEEGGDESDDEDDPETDPKDGKPQARGRDGQGGATGGKPGEKAAAFFDRKEIDQIQDPKAKEVAQRAYASMQRAFTQKTTELAEERKEWEGRVAEADTFRTEYEDFVREIGSNDGAEQFLHLVIDSRPHVFTENVLVALALKSPDIFEKAVERYQQLAQDDDARSTFEDKIEVGRGKYEAGQRDRVQQRTQAASQQQRLAQAVTTRAGTHKVTDADSLEIIQGQVSLLIQRNRAAQKRTTMEDINAVVDRVAQRLARTRDAGRQDGERKGRKERQDAVRDTARRARDRRPAPSGRRVGAERGEYKPPERDEDRIGALVDHFFG